MYSPSPEKQHFFHKVLQMELLQHYLHANNAIGQAVTPLHAHQAFLVNRLRDTSFVGCEHESI